MGKKKMDKTKTSDEVIYERLTSLHERNGKVSMRNLLTWREYELKVKFANDMKLIQKTREELSDTEMEREVDLHRDEMFMFDVLAEWKGSELIEMILAEMKTEASWLALDFRDETFE